MINNSYAIMCPVPWVVFCPLLWQTVSKWSSLIEQQSLGKCLSPPLCEFQHLLTDPIWPWIMKCIIIKTHNKTPTRHYISKCIFDYWDQFFILPPLTTTPLQAKSPVMYVSPFCAHAVTVGVTKDCGNLGLWAGFAFSDQTTSSQTWLGLSPLRFSSSQPASCCQSSLVKGRNVIQSAYGA